MSNEEYLNNMNVQYSPEENEDNYEHSDSNNPELNRGIITRFLDSKLDTYNDRISSLEEKNTLLNEKIQRNQSKIDKFNSRIAKLEKQNIFLRSIAQAYPQYKKAVNLLIEKNIDKINNLKNKKIPAKFNKIEKHKASIKYNENQIYKLQLKVKTCENIKEYFHSFSIKNPELRHDKFMNCLKSINDSSKYKLENRLYQFENKLDSLNAKLETNRYMQKHIGNNPKMLEYLQSKEKSYLNKITKLERKTEKIKTKLDKYQTLSKGIQGIETEPPANKSQHIEEMMSKNESVNNSLAEIVANLSESSITDRVVLSNAAIISDLNIHISREPIQTEKTAAMKENISEKQPVQSSEISEKSVKVNESAAEKQSVKSADITVNNSNKITKDIFDFESAKIFKSDKSPKHEDYVRNDFARIELKMNDALWERFAENGLVLDDTSINKVIFETSNNGMGFGKFYIPTSKPYFVPASIPADKILTAAERSVIKDVTSKLLSKQTEKTAAVKENNSTNQASQSKNKSNITDKKDKTSSVLNSKTKSLLGELYNNQGKLSEINKTADLGKNMTKTPEVSL
ncbi:MAG: hypothetical protein KH444_07920 [Ruminococcus sp.]|nr:hypothetical protein [Ruminococcus sp.]